MFVLNDGGEVDLDLGNYERFLDINLYKDNNITTGKIYQHVINKERRGDYLGKTVQGIVSHTAQRVVSVEHPHPGRNGCEGRSSLSSPSSNPFQILLSSPFLFSSEVPASPSMFLIVFSSVFFFITNVVFSRYVSVCSYYL